MRQIAANLLPLLITFCRLISGRVFPLTISLGDGVSKKLFRRASVCHAIYPFSERIVFRLVAVMVMCQTELVFIFGLVRPVDGSHLARMVSGQNVFRITRQSILSPAVSAADLGWACFSSGIRVICPILWPCEGLPYSADRHS